MQDFTQFLSHHPELSITLGIIIVLLLIVELVRGKRHRISVSPTEATHLMNHDNAVIIDVRAQDLYEAGHIIHAQHMNHNQTELTKKLDKFKNKPLIVVCNLGNESQKTAASLVKAGYNARSLAGGMRAWIQAGMPIIKE
jgi:rhodanese-related sulfurtransferase